MKIISALMMFALSGVISFATLSAQQDPCLGPSCKCVSIAEMKQSTGNVPIVGTHSLGLGPSNHVLGSAKVSAGSGYTTGSVDGVCSEVGCECAEKKCEFHYVLEISITDWGSLNPSTVSSLNWKWRNHGGNINISSGLPAVITKAADFDFACGTNDVERTIKVIADFNVAGSNPEVVAVVTALFECLDCPNA
jgi:hypothetical protein